MCFFDEVRFVVDREKDKPKIGLERDQVAQRFESAKNRHADIRNDDVGSEPDGSVDERQPVVDRTDYLELGLQETAKDIVKGCVVICQENGWPSQLQFRYRSKKRSVITGSYRGNMNGT